MKPVYRVRNWLDHFETADSRKRAGPMEWTKMRTKHDGRGYRRVTRLRNATTALCGWYLLVQVAAKMPVRGLLADLDGPLGPLDLADKTGIPENAFKAAFEELQKENIGWIEQLKWDENLNFEANLARLGMEQQGAAGNGRERQGAAGSGTGPDPNSDQFIPRGAAGNGTERQGAAESGTERQGAAGSGVQYSTVQEKRESTEKRLPPAVPQGGQSKANPRITDPEEAKREICEKIIGGRDPSRAWSYDAQHRLSELTTPPGMPRYEIERIAWFRGLPANPDIPELAKRKFPITETTLMGFWGDEFQRADAYWKKTHAGSNGTAVKKGWPPRGREFFLWKYGDEVRLPETFDELPADQRKEWEREHVKFESGGAKSGGKSDE